MLFILFVVKHEKSPDLLNILDTFKKVLLHSQTKQSY